MLEKFLAFGLLTGFLSACQMKNNSQSDTLDDQTQVQPPPAQRETNEPVDQQFSPSGDIKSGILAALAKATKSVDVAIYSLGDKQVITALQDLGKRGLQIRLILNQPTKKCKIRAPGEPKANNFCDQMEDAGIDVRYVTPVMHHKVGIIDGGQSGTFDNVQIMTGSANWSHTAFAVYDEDWLRYEGDSDLARDFQRDFNYLWDHAKDYPGVTVAQATQAFQDGNSQKVFFTSANSTKNQAKGSFKWDATKSTVSSQVVAAFDSATTSIKVGHAHFRTPEISEAVSRAHDRGVKVQIVLDQQEFRPGSEFSNDNLYFEEALAKKNVDVRYKVYSVKWSHTTAKQLHSKFSIADDKIVFTGSYNWSENAENNTFENMVIVTEPGIVKKYVDQFEIILNYRAGEYATLMSRLDQGVTAADCHMNPMTMTIPEFVGWRAKFSSMCN
jgi:phosphatidylserine/phosphatidylglycerophosphate/cardiolipin synthase-like enzyme